MTGRMNHVRLLIYLLSALLLSASATCAQLPEKLAHHQEDFDFPDRTWLGPHFWANRLQDWAIQNGRAVCVADPVLPFRTAHLLGRRLSGTGTLSGEIHLEAVSAGRPGALGGLLLGAGAAISGESASLVHAWPGPGAGIFVGVNALGHPTIVDLSDPKALHATAGALEGDLEQASEPMSAGTERRLTFRYDREAQALIVLLHDADNNPTWVATREIAPERLVGNIALVSHGGPGRGKKKTRFAFHRIGIHRDALSTTGATELGPILCAPYTLSRGELGMTCQLMPDAFTAESRVTLEIEGNAAGTWALVAEAGVNEVSCTAQLRAPYPHAKRHRFRLRYYRASGEADAEASFLGSITPDPGDAEPLRLAATNCLHQNAHALGSAATDWTRQVWFPHRDLVDRVRHARPHLLFFAGDQIYEGRSPTFADRNHLRLDYLYKWYLWCWTWRDLLRHTPAVVIPDDHDIYQGNLWGEGGRPAKRDHLGGYVHPAWFVQMVERTQTGHLPRPADPRPVSQDIGTYFTELLFGRVSFAILEDRKFKSGCKRPGMPPSGTGRPDHFNDPEFDRRQLDIEGLELLGERQHEFLDRWAADWSGADMKAALSQTHFANMATHHGSRLRYLLADLDSNGWPQTGRRRAVEALRRAFAVHICGDQHLASLIRHGVDEHRDAGWAFCVPASANFYPRAFFPKAPSVYRHPAPEEFLGDRVDGFGNLVSVFAAANPGISMGQPNATLHDQMPGWGLIVFDTKKRTTRFEAWPRFADPKVDRPYRGWPRTVPQSEGDGRERRYALPEIRIEGLEEAVVQVREAKSGRLVYALRLAGDRHRPRVARAGRYRLRVGDPDRDQWQDLGEFEATRSRPGPARTARF
jgi:hypothetical protein